MFRRAIPVSGKLLVSGLLAALVFLLLAGVCRLRDCTCNPRSVDSLAVKDTRIGWLAVNAATGLLYADRADAMDIAVFDADHIDRGPLALVPTLGYIGGMALDETANKLYLAQSFSQRVRVIDGRTHEHHDIEVPDLVNAMNSVAVDPQRQRLYVTRNDNHDIAVFDTGTEKLLRTIDEGCCPSASTFLAVDPSTGFLFVLNNDPPHVAVFDAEARRVAQVPVGDAPLVIAIDSAALRAYVTNGDSLHITVIDIAPGRPEAFTIIGNIEMRERPTHIAIDSAAGRAYVSQVGTNFMGLIDLARSRRIKDFEVGHAPQFVAVDPATSRIFATEKNGIDEIRGCSAPDWPWQAPAARPPAAIATPPPLTEPTAVAERRAFVRCNRMFRIRTNCADGPDVHEARLAKATIEAAGAKVVDGGAAGKICGAGPDSGEAEFLAAGFYYSVPVLEPGSDAPVVWTFHSTSRTFAVKDPPPSPAMARAADPPDAPWAEALWYLSRYKTGSAPEAAAGCE